MLQLFTLQRFQESNYRFSSICSLGRPTPLFQLTVLRSMFRLEEARMRRDDLMKPDLVSEIVLLGSGTLVLLLLILTVVVTLTRIALLP